MTYVINYLLRDCVRRFYGEGETEEYVLEIPDDAVKSFMERLDYVKTRYGK